MTAPDLYRPAFHGIDRCSVERFADGGAVVITEQVFAPPGRRTLLACANGGPTSLSSATTWTMQDCGFHGTPTP